MESKLQIPQNPDHWVNLYEPPRTNTGRGVVAAETGSTALGSEVEVVELPDLTVDGRLPEPDQVVEA